MGTGKAAAGGEWVLSEPARADGARAIVPAGAGEGGGAGTPWGWWCEQHITRGAALPTDVRAGDRVVLWSGGLGEGLFEDDPRTWMSAGANALDAALTRLLDAGEHAGSTIVIRPHAAHVVSDAPSVVRTLACHPRVRVLLDPAGMLTPSMLSTAHDHVERILSICAAQAPDGVLGVIVRPVATGLTPSHLHAMLAAAPATWARVRWPG